MEMGYFARRTLLPMIMEWVEQSRMRKSLPAHECRFIEHLGADASLQINLSNLSQHYKQKHIEPNMENYCNAFVKQVTPVLRNWCLRCNLQEAKIKLRFKAHYIHSTEINITIPREELKKHHDL